MWDYYHKPIHDIISTDVSLPESTKTMYGDFNIHSVITLNLTKLKMQQQFCKSDTVLTENREKSTIFTNMYNAFVRLKCFQCIHSLYNIWFLYGVSYQIPFKTPIMTLLKKKTEKMSFYKNTIAQVLKHLKHF